MGLNYSPEPTGIAPYTTGFAEGMAANGHQVTVLTTHPHYPEWRIRDGFGRWTDRRYENNVRISRLRHYVPARVSSARRLLAEVSFGLRAATHRWDRPDVVVLVSPALFSSAITLARARFFRRRVPVGVWIQDLYGLGIAETDAGGGAIGKMVTGIETRVLQSADGACVIHDRFANHLSNRLGIEPERVSVVRNWTHLVPAPTFDPVAFRLQMGWKPDETIVLHAGAQGQKQGLETVIEAARLAERDGERVRFILLGNGGQRGALETLAVGASCVEFVDPLPGDAFQMAMSSADVLLVNERPGLSEMAVPSKLTSYFSTGRPIVAATDYGSVTASEIALSGGGIRVDAGDSAALLAGVVSLRDAPEVARKLGEAGRQFQTETLGHGHAMAELEAWVQQLATHRGVPMNSHETRSYESGLV